MLTSHLTGRVLQVTLDRPEKRNALSMELARRLADTLDEASSDSRVGSILLAASGKAFCAGMDLGEMGRVDPTELGQVHERLFTSGARLRKPLIAAVHGAALAGGTGLVANAHIVFATPEATFGLTEIRLGLWPFVIYRAIVAAVGARRTLELSLSGRIFASDQAAQYGLVHIICSANELLQQAEATARRIAESSPVAIDAGLEYAQALHTGSADADLAASLRDQVMLSSDFQEGISAYIEKRSPRWPSLQK
jgi:enoyl-CoA hydratase/carnithine racemase